MQNIEKILYQRDSNIIWKKKNVRHLGGTVYRLLKVERPKLLDR